MGFPSYAVGEDGGKQPVLIHGTKMAARTKKKHTRSYSCIGSHVVCDHSYVMTVAWPLVHM